MAIDVQTDKVESKNDSQSLIDSSYFLQAASARQEGKCLSMKLGWRMIVQLAFVVMANPSAKPSAGRLASTHAKFPESVAQSVMVNNIERLEMRKYKLISFQFPPLNDR